MAAVHAFQILNHYTSPQELDPGFGVLNNSANEKPDWYEYWPIRNYLLGNSLDPNAFYGFLSPKFALKTNLTASDVMNFAASAPVATDVLLFSPSIHNSSRYWNVFQHGDAEHPGLAAVAAQFFARLGRKEAYETLVTDSRNTVHSNYFLAKPRFWHAWLDMTEHMFTYAQTADDPLGIALRTPTNYRGKRDVHMKIFLMERIASFLLATDDSFVARARDPFAARTRLYKMPLAVVCDALKIAYIAERRGQYKDVFMLMSALSEPWGRQLRMADWLGVPSVRRAVRQLRRYWDERPG